MRETALIVLLSMASAWMTSLANADAKSEYMDALAKLGQNTSKINALMIDGRIDDAEAALQTTFPEKTRTGPEMIALADTLYSFDQKLSYPLYRRAAAVLHDQGIAVVSWAMAQQSEGQYAGAAYRYAEPIKSTPDSLLDEGLLAECLIRQGNLREAVDAWIKLAQALDGRWELFDPMDCHIHFHPTADRQRQELIKKAKGGNIDAAEQLIELDARFPVDWWNNGPRAPYLKHDLDMLRQGKSEGPEIKEILCAGECCLAAVSKGSPADVLRNDGFLLDDGATLPKSGRMLSLMLDNVLDTRVPAETARQKWGQQILEQLKTSKDPGLFATAEAIYLRTDQRMAIDQQGWDATGEARFADSVLIQLDEQGKLTTDEPHLVKAQQQFPDDAVIARIVFEHTRKEGKPIEPALIKAIEAEYSHFSCPPSSDRPSAFRLNQYFGLLDQALKQQ